MKAETNIDKKNINKLSILISQDGFSFCVHNNIELVLCDKFVFKTPDNNTPTQLLNEVKNRIDTRFIKNHQIEKLDIIYHNHLFALVPTKIYDENKKVDYLKYSVRLLENDYITSDAIEAFKAQNIYIPLININNYFIDLVGNFNYKHQLTQLIENAIQINAEDLVLTHIESNLISIVVIKNNTLLLGNCFQISSEEDAAYYLLFVLNELELNREEIPLYFSGEFDEHSNFYEYINPFVKHIYWYNNQISENLRLSLPTEINLNKYSLLISSL
ncbi:MAG: DUF3822 family protein [Bacteroidota bacterium]